MEPIRFAIAGNGYRALRYLRAARELPEWFTVTAMLCRTPERAQEIEARHGIKAVASLDALMETRPEFVLSCVSFSGMSFGRMSSSRILVCCFSSSSA